MTIEKIEKNKEYQKLIKYNVKKEFIEEYVNYKLKKEHNPKIIKAIRKYIDKPETEELFKNVTFTVEPAKTMIIGGTK